MILFLGSSAQILLMELINSLLCFVFNLIISPMHRLHSTSPQSLHIVCSIINYVWLQLNHLQKVKQYFQSLWHFPIYAWFLFQQALDCKYKSIFGYYAYIQFCSLFNPFHTTCFFSMFSYFGISQSSSMQRPLIPNSQSQICAVFCFDFIDLSLKSEANFMLN